MSAHHKHQHPRNVNKKRLLLALLIVGSWMFVELIGGLWTGSLALLADAGHMFSDFFNLLISLVAINVASRAATNKKTFGNHRYEILAALFNGAALLGIALFILYEALQRAGSEQVILGGPMALIAFIGLLANLLCLYVLAGGDVKKNLNMRGAFFHVIGDTLGSVGALVAGICIYLFGWYFMDLWLSCVIALLIAIAGWNIVRQSIHILLEATPAHIDCAYVSEQLLELEGVKGVHDLHVWTITSGLHSLTCHLVLDEDYQQQSQQVLLQARRWIEDNLGIYHCTIQVEYPDLQYCEHDGI